MTASDPFLAEIVTRFEAFDVQAGRGGYTLRHRRSRTPVARLRPIPDSDRTRPLAHLRRLRPPQAHPRARSRDRPRRTNLPPPNAL